MKGTIYSVILILNISFLSVTSNAGDFHVATSGNDSTGDGSITKPWKTITHALAVLDGTPSNPHVIHVAPGTYSLTQTGETYPLVMKSYISLQGVGDSLTILDGAFRDRIIQCQSVTEIKIDGFTIKRGYENHGAGISIRYSSFVIVSNNTIIQNRATGTVASGGGLSVGNSSYLLVTQNKFHNNFSGADGAGGGGLCLSDIQHSIISNNLIKSNKCYALFGGAGGGIFYTISDLIIRNNTIDSNISDYIGGGMAGDNSALIIRNTFINNIAGFYYGGLGGGAYLHVGSSILGNSINNGNNIHNNTALDDPYYQGRGNQIATQSGIPVEARYNYFGDSINLNDPHEIYGSFILEPHMISPVVFDTSNLVVVPSPIYLDNLTVGKQKNVKVDFFNVTNSLIDSIMINDIVHQSSDISFSEKTFTITPTGKHPITINILPTSPGQFSDSLRIETNIGDFIVHMEGIISDSTTSIETKELILPANYRLEQNYPNPFNPMTVIKYQLPKENWVTLKIYNTFCQEVETLVDGTQVAGYKSVEFNASNLASGIYYYKLMSGSFVDLKKMILIK